MEEQKQTMDELLTDLTEVRMNLKNLQEKEVIHRFIFPLKFICAREILSLLSSMQREHWILNQTVHRHIFI